MLCCVWLCCAAQGNIRESEQKVDEATKAKMLCCVVLCCDIRAMLCCAAQGNIRESEQEVDEATKAKMAQFVNKTIMMEEVIRARLSC
jgi:hypothetical protein